MTLEQGSGPLSAGSVPILLAYSAENQIMAPKLQSFQGGELSAGPNTSSNPGWIKIHAEQDTVLGRKSFLGSAVFEWWAHEYMCLHGVVRDE